MRRLLTIVVSVLFSALFVAFGYQSAHAADTGTISGTVTGAGNAALANAYVYAYNFDGPGSYAGSGYTDASGNYTMSNLPAGRYRIQFGASNYSGEYWDNARSSANATAVTVTAGQTTPAISARLDANPTISGTVRDADSNPLQGASVYISGANTGTSVTTGVDGRYSVNYLPVGDNYTIRFSPPSGTPWLTEYWDNRASANTADTFDLSEGQQFTADASLARGAQIKGTVTSDGSAVSGVGVVVRQGYEVIAYSRTAADGTYASTGLPPGLYKVGFVMNSYGYGESSPYLPQWYDNQVAYENADTVTVAGSSDVTGIDADLAQGGTITGKVTAPDNSNAASIQVSAQPVGSGNSTTTTTAADGTYSITGLRAGQYRVKFEEGYSSTKGYAPQWWQGAGLDTNATAISVTEGATTPDINATMWSGASIAGTVTDSDGNPVSNASVSSQNPTYRSTYTDANGRYTLTGLAEGSHRLQISAPYGSNLISEYWDDKPDSSSADVIALTRGQAATGKNAVLAKGAQISGTVTGPNGPLAGVSVQASQGWSSSAYTTTAADGTYTIKGLRAGNYTVWFSPQSNEYLQEYYDDATSSNDAQAVTVAAGAEVPGINAQLAPASTISGTVKTAAGLPVAGASVSAQGTGGAYGSAQTAADGTYTIGRLRAGSYTVQFSGTGKLLPQWYDHQATRSAANPVVLGVDQDKTGINADLEPGKVITGTVTDEQGIPLAGVSVNVHTDEWNDVAYATTDSRGTYTTPGLPPGTYKVEFSPNYLSDYLREWYDDASNFNLATPITIGATDEVADAELAKASVIQGTVTDGSDPVNGYVTLETPDGDYIDSAPVYSDGTYRLRARAGTYTVAFIPYSGGGLMREWWDNKRSSATADPIVLGKEQTFTANAELETGGVITGTVRDPQNNPLPGVRVTANGSSSASATTKADGTYRIIGLSPDTYDVRFRGVGELGTQWYNGVQLRRDATPVPVALSATVSGIDATLRPAQVLTGTVSTAGGQPVEDVQVTVYKKGAGWYTASTYTQADGTFRTSQLSDGDYEVRLRPEGDSEWAMQWYNGAPSRQRASTVTLSGGQSSDIAATLQRGGSISGTVTRSGGTGLAGVYVSASNGRDYRSTLTNADGSYQIKGLITGQYTVEFDADYDTGVLDEWYDNATDYDDATLVPVVAGEDTPGIDAALTVAGSISGTVTSGGNPLQGVEMEAYRDGSYYRYASTRQDGTFTFSTLPPGTYTIVAYGEDGLATQWWSGASTQATATGIPVNGQAVTGKDFALVAGGSISGTVTTFEGGSPGDGWVAVYSNGRRVASGEMDDNGSFRIAGLATGEYLVQVSPYDDYPTTWWRDGYSEDTAEPVAVVAGADTPLAMTLPKLTSVTGTVLDGVGNPVAANVRLYRVGDDDWVNGASTRADGSYSIPRVRPGNYQIQFAPGADNFASQWWNGAARRATAQLATVGDTAFTANAVVVKGGTLSGTITDGSNVPVGGAQVRAYLSAERYVSAVSDASGQYLFTGLDDAEYRLYAKPGSSRLELVGTWLGGADYAGATPVTVGNGASVVRNVTLQRGATVSGRVIDGNGTPVPGIGVDLFDEDRRKSLTAWTGADGRYTTSGLLAGTYTARFMPGYYGGDGLAEQWWNDKPRFSQATQFTLSAQQQRTGVDATLRAIKAGTTAPGAPRDVVATAGNREVTLRWSVPATNGGLTITRYKVTGAPGGECQTLGELACTITGLTNGTTYQFSVQAGNTVGLSSPSGAVSAVPFGKPSAPTSVVATAGVERASVRWAAADANGRPVTTYTVTSSPGQATCTTAGTTCDVVGLTAGSYTFSVTATNEGGTSDPSAASNAVTVAAGGGGGGGGGGAVTPPAGGGAGGGGAGAVPGPAAPAPTAPSAPAGVKPAVKKRKLTVTWQTVPGATSYQVRVNRKGKPGKWKTVSAPKFAAGKLAKGKYTVEVKAIGAAGSSPVKRVSVKVK